MATPTDAELRERARRLGLWGLLASWDSLSKQAWVRDYLGVEPLLRPGREPLRVRDEQQVRGLRDDADDQGERAETHQRGRREAGESQDVEVFFERLGEPILLFHV